MSTVLITPTHIASDHTYLHKYYPSECTVDISYRKLFVSPNKAFIVGTCGNFIPSDIDTPEVHNAILDIIGELLTQSVLKGLKNDITSIYVKTKALRVFKDVFDYTYPTIIVTKANRWVIKFPDIDSDAPAVKICADYAGLGSGGFFGTGLLLGGIKLPKVWEPLHRIDPQTSLEHTIIPLSILKPWTIRGNEP